MSQAVLQQLVEMSNYLGATVNTYAILGEGNTSARVDSDTFLIKASGTTLGTIDASGFVALSISRVTAVLDDPNAGDAEVSAVFKTALVDPKETRRPSVEAMLHALLYQYEGINFIGHTHPVFTCMLLCSKKAEEAVSGRVCPDQIVVMAHKSVYVPYVDPGLVLAREVRRRMRDYVEEEGVLPKAIMMQSHGMIALGDSAKAVNAITDMAEKSSRIIFGTYSVGGPQFMTPEHVARIYTRPDEKYRQKIIG